MQLKKIKIFCFPSHASTERTSGVDFARVIQPLKYLNGYKDDEVEIETHIWDVNTKEETNWLGVAETYDIIYLNYINNPWGFAAMGAMARKHGVKLVLDLDDDLWDILPDNPAAEVFKKDGEAIKNFTAICNEVDYMTCTNSYLKNVIVHNTMKRHEQIKVFPNYIDLKLYSHRSLFKDTHQIQITHFGSTTHFIDLSSEGFIDGMDKILKEYPNVSVKFVGALLPSLKEKWGARYVHDYGHTDIFHWVQDKNKFPKFMDETDIVVAPLAENVYNRCKSSIKFLEASSAKKPGVWEKIRPYAEIVDGTNGFLAHSSQEWYDKLKILIDDVVLRKKMGEEAFKTVKNDWQLKDHLKEYATFFKDILTK